MIHPLTDDQLRRIAVHMATKYGHDQAYDRMGIGEMLDDVLAEYDIPVPDALNPDVPGWDEDGYDAVIHRIADLIRAATITVEWPGVGPVVDVPGPAGTVSGPADAEGADA